MTERNNLSTKIILMVECILLISSILFCTVSVYRERGAIRRTIQQRMLDIANCASGSVNGDVLGDLEKEDVGSKEYNDIYDSLAVFRDNVELEYVYSIKEDGDDNFIFTMDLDPDTPAAYGDSVKYTRALDMAGSGRAAVDEVPYSDKWGEFYSAYSPVFDSSGKVAGIIAVDFSADWFDEQLTTQTRDIIISYIIILLVTILIAAILSILVVRPFVGFQERLLEEKLRAESANNAKSEFLANMSHEIRTPINAVLGMNEMILRENARARELTADNSKEALEAIKNVGVFAGDVKQAGNNLLAIVNDILDFSRIEAGRMDIIEAPYGLSSLLNDLNNMIRFKAQEKGLDFSIAVDESLPDELSGDEVRVRQILTNILNNAVKYTDHGAVSLKVSGETDENGMLLLTAAVQDTGIGIRPEDIDKLFSKFQRLEMEHNSTLEGTGLGLAITRRLLDKMNGTVDVKSEYGKGSLFTVTIPQKILSKEPVGNLQERFETYNKENSSYRETFRAPDARILVVDDTKINLTVVVNLLKNTEMKIDTASSGAAAVELAKKNAYDLILMDQRMPEMDGTKALHMIRETEGGESRNVPIICLTANAVVGTKDRYIAEGFSDYLTKPIEIATLETTLIRYLPPGKVKRLTVEDDLPESGMRPDPEHKGKDFSVLRDAGVDIESGLGFCQNDETFYLTMLDEYVRSASEKREALQRYYEAGDMENYSIHAHSLKSTSKMIGATALSDRAREMEDASDSGDMDTVRKGHGAMMESYGKLTEAIHILLPETADAMDDDSDEIIEFLPEDPELLSE